VNPFNFIPLTQPHSQIDDGLVFGAHALMGLTQRKEEKMVLPSFTELISTLPRPSQENMKPEVTSQVLVGEKQKRGYIRIKRPPPKPKAASKRGLTKQVTSSTLSKCHCQQDCLTSFFGECLGDIVSRRNELVMKPQQRQKQAVLEFLTNNTDPVSKITTWTLYGKRMCKAAWAISQGVPERTLRDFEKSWKGGVRADTLFHGNLGTIRPRPET